MKSSWIILGALLLILPLLGADNPLSGILGPESLKRAELSGVRVLPGERSDSVILKFAARDKPSTLVLQLPPAARNWTQFRTLVFEFTSDTTINWNFGVRNRRGELCDTQVRPLQGVPVKAAIPVALLCTEYMNSRAYKGYWVQNWLPHVDMTEAETIQISMQPMREATLKLGPLALLKEPATDEIYVDKPVIDQFGQWIPREWPGKVHSVEEARTAWRKDDEDLAKAKAEDFGFCRYGGWKARSEKATGFFHTAQIDGKWWLVDPDGHLFYSIGMNGVGNRSASRVTGREALFAKLPAGASDTADFYNANLRLRYGEDQGEQNWRSKTAQRLKAWGFNTITSPSLAQADVPYVTTMSVGRSRKSWENYPDAFSKNFVSSAEQQARAQCERFLDDRLLVGYFIGNEPRWPERSLIDLILKDPESSETQNFVRAFLNDKGDTPGTREALLEALARQYFKTAADAIRRADPNHLILGTRLWYRCAPDAVLRAHDVFDVVSINMYRFEPRPDQIQHIYDLVKKPILIGEFHFGVPERGYAPALVMVKNQRERGVAYQYFAERGAALAPIVGAHWFSYVDQPLTGRSDGENYNFGFINQLDLGYRELVSFATAAHKRIYSVHAGVTRATRRAVVGVNVYP